MHGIATSFVCVVSRYNGFISIILVLQDFGKKNMAVPGTFDVTFPDNRDLFWASCMLMKLYILS